MWLHLWTHCIKEYIDEGCSVGNCICHPLCPLRSRQFVRKSGRVGQSRLSDWRVQKINANGTYSVGTTDTFQNVKIYATNQATGHVSYVIASAKDGNWSGQLALIAGKYTVYAELTWRDNTGSLHLKDSISMKDIVVTAN